MVALTTSEMVHEQSTEVLKGVDGFQLQAVEPTLGRSHQGCSEDPALRTVTAKRHFQTNRGGPRG